MNGSTSLIHGTKHIRGTSMVTKTPHRLIAHSRGQDMGCSSSCICFTLFFVAQCAMSYNIKHYHDWRTLKDYSIKSMHKSLVLNELMSWILRQNLHLEKLLKSISVKKKLQDLCDKWSLLSVHQFIYLKIRKYYFYLAYIRQGNRENIQIMIVNITTHAIINLSCHFPVLGYNAIQMQLSKRLMFIN